MEVGQQGVDDAEFMAGIDEDFGLAATGANAGFSRLLSCEFEGADGGGADGYYAAAGGFGVVDGVGGRFGDFIGLAVEFMVFDVFRADGLEGSEAHVEGDFSGFDSTGLDLLENFRSEVEAGGGSGYGSAGFGVDGLIAIAIGGIVGAGDVGWERDVAEAVEAGEEVGDWAEADAALTVGSAGDDFGFEFGGGIWVGIGGIAEE